jgi:hypothetical protein
MVNGEGIFAFPPRATAPPDSGRSRPVPVLPVALTSARPDDWPATNSLDWEHILRTVVTAGRYRLVVDAAAGPGPDLAGELRVLVAGTPVTSCLPVRACGGRHVVDLVTGDLEDIVVQGRCVAGGAPVRAVAVLLTPA